MDAVTKYLMQEAIKRSKNTDELIMFIKKERVMRDYRVELSDAFEHHGKKFCCSRCQIDSDSDVTWSTAMLNGHGYNVCPSCAAVLSDFGERVERNASVEDAIKHILNS